MPELKRNFLRGRMNKDLDERLVPSGEYRDALNIEISTSEGSNVGSAQTLRGNKLADTTSYHHSTSVTVGQYVDEENEAIYNFVHNKLNTFEDTNYANYTSGDLPRIIGHKIDSILKHVKDPLTESVTTEIVFNDVYEVRVANGRVTPGNQTITGLTNFQWNRKTGGPSILPSDTQFVDTFVAQGLKPGMRVQAIDVNGNDLWDGKDVRVISVQDSVGGQSHTIKITPVNGFAIGYNEHYGNTMIADGVVLKFSADRILDFRAGTEELETNNKLADESNAYSTKQYTPNGNIITGINVIDDLLFWTDGRGEPKKINISDSIKGTAYPIDNVNAHIFNPTRVYSSSEKSRLGWQGVAELSNITVIKPAPIKPPKVKVLTSIREGITSSTLKRQYGSGELAHFAFRDNDASYVFSLGPIDSLFTPTNLDANWKVGDVLDLVESTTSAGVPIVSPKTASIRITSYHPNLSGSFPYYRVDLVAIDSTYTIDRSPAFWTAKLSEKETPIYEQEFVCFAYRYKYNDGETSVISPYTKPIFLPGRYEYDPKEGFNLGMLNNMKSVEISGFYPENTPQDVVSIEILYRDTNKANQVNSIKTIDLLDVNSRSYRDNIDTRSVVIDAELFGPTLPSDQVDRNQDIVPTSAVAQEITASRLMYGNYTENYDPVDVSLEATLTPKPSSLATSSSFSENIFRAVQDGELLTLTAPSHSDVYNGKLALTLEDSDPGDNYENDPAEANPFEYIVPEDGVYSFSASCKWLARNEIIAASATTTTSPDNFLHFTPARLVIRRNIAGTDPLVPSGTEIIDETTIENAYIPEVNAPGTFYRPGNQLGVDTIPSWEPVVLSLNIQNVKLNQGDKLYLEVQPDENLPSEFTYLFSGGSIQPAIDYVSGSGDHSWTPGSFTDPTQIDYAKVSSASWNCYRAPETDEGSFVVSSGVESIKSMRNIDVGVVYRDAFNRQSTVFLDETLKVKVDKGQAVVANNLTLSILSQAPSWAKYYKFFVKENTNKFYNLVLAEAVDNEDGHAWLLFNTVDIDKLKEEDYLILKKKHNSVDSVTANEAKWKALEITTTAPESVITDASTVEGKFFVKIAIDGAFTTYLGSLNEGDALTLPSTSGAVFETEPKKVLESEDIAIYYEASRAYPIKLDTKDAASYIERGSRITYYDSSYSNENIIDGIKSQLNQTEVLVNNVRGAYTFSKSLIEAAAGYVSASSASPDHAYCVVTASKDLNISITPGNHVDLKFTNEDGSFVIARAVASTTNQSKIYLLPYTCPVSDFGNVTLAKGLEWYNCIMFGNGVESDAIRDDFNSDTIFEYVASGKTSGFKANLFYEDYKPIRRKNDIIFSQSINEKIVDSSIRFNRLNEFLAGEDIVKQLAPEYGSIQKLFTRDSDLLAFCENKVLQIFAEKDELFNADGTSLTIDSRKVLGRARPFAGDYGISKNPESFASDEFRVYFTDKARGSVLRLSRDGITTISDYGMKNWFYDNLANSQALIGSFDGKKNQYNITVHSVTNPEVKKDVYTVSFSESVNGWNSFKGFIKEAGATLNNFYYTFKNGKPWIHHSEGVNRNIFYNKQYDSSIRPIFNDVPGSVKSFSTINYEGTQSKVTQNTDSLDNNYYNLTNQNGWYVKSISTDLQEGKVNEFINKEGKWFNNIIGETTTFSNAADSGIASGNLDTRESNVQGLGVLQTGPTLISGDIDGFGFELTLPITLGDNVSII